MDTVGEGESGMSGESSINIYKNTIMCEIDSSCEAVV